jgi:predicted dehydrogenase
MNGVVMRQRLNRDPLQVGIIGAGRIGRVHAESITFRLPQARVLAITDVSREAAQAVAARCEVPVVASSSAEIFGNPEIEAVLICSSTDTHAELIVQAAEAGKHIFCEKPISLSLAEIDRALAAVNKAGVQLQIGFNRRFDANFARVRRAVVEGEVGRPQLMHIVSRDPEPPPPAYVKVSGGMFMDMTIHDFDMARFLMGDEVEEIYTSAGVMVDAEIGKAAAVSPWSDWHDRQLPQGCVWLRSAGGGAGQRRQDCDGEPVSEPGFHQHGALGLHGPAAELLHGAVHGELCQRAGVVRCGYPRTAAGGGDGRRRAHTDRDGAGGAEVL